MSSVEIQCRNCVHYYITYDPSKPHGCRAVGFKSRQNPARVVLANSGLSCQLYTSKNNKNSPEKKSRTV